MKGVTCEEWVEFSEILKKKDCKIESRKIGLNYDKSPKSLIPLAQKAFLDITKIRNWKTLKLCTIDNGTKSYLRQNDHGILMKSSQLTKVLN